MWLSGDHKIADVINSILAPGRPTIGEGAPLPCNFPSSPCVSVGKAGCTLLGGLGEMILNLTVVGIGVRVDRVQIFTRPGYFRAILLTCSDLILNYLART